MTLQPELFYFIGAAILGLAIAWGVYQSSRRNRRNDPITNAATRELYRDPEHYDETREALKKELHPS